jgi:hypothetical protein
MIVCTNIYAPNNQAKEMVNSFERFGYEMAITNAEFPYGRVFNNLVQLYRRAATGHETFIYSDGGDTYCQKPFTIPNDRLIWSTEKQCFPHPEMAKDYPNARTKTEWKYLNNGGYGGNLELMIEFVDKYIGKLPMTANCQLETMQAFLQAKKDGFPIYLDYKCKTFQTIAFDPVKPEKGEAIDRASFSNHMDEKGNAKYMGTDFKIVKGLVVNKMTKSTPAILHGNGRTPMQWIYDLNK